MSKQYKEMRVVEVERNEDSILDAIAQLAPTRSRRRPSSAKVPCVCLFASIMKSLSHGL